MRKQVKLLIFAVVFISMLAFMPTNVSADDDDDYDGYLDVDITDAHYCDYDGDGSEDDVVTVFEVDIRKSDDWDGGVFRLQTYLILPSGYGWVYTFYVKAEGDFQITMIWYNCAIESGWYTFYVFADALGSEAPRSGYDSIVFDPPGGGDPDMPEISIFIT